MFRRLLISMSVLLTYIVLAATNTFVVKPFAVANINTNPGTGTLVGTAYVENANSPFSIISNAVLNVPSGQTQNVYIAFDTSKVGAFSNRVIFISNGGNSTNSVTGTIIPSAPKNLKTK